MSKGLRKWFLVARHEYNKMVRRKSFLIGTLGVPLLIVVVMAVAISVAVGGADDRPVGYVDHAGVLDASLLPPEKGRRRAIEMRAYPDEDAARAALESGEIQALYVLPAEYLASGRMTLTYWDDAPGDAVWAQFDDFLRANLVATQPGDVQVRAVDGLSLTVRAADGSREVHSEDYMAFALPFGAGFFLMMAIITSSGYLLQAVTTEKENRTMEVLITSLSPGQLVTGKAAGLMAVSLTQLGIWALTIIVGLVVGAQFLEPLRAARVPWAALGIAALYFFPSYVLIAGIMISIGSVVTETRQGQQIAGIVNLFFAAPFSFSALIIANPNSPALVVMTLFPTTSFITVIMRWSLSGVPAWQMVLSWILLVAAAGLGIWAAGRIFRAGMLRYGQRLDLRGVFRAIRARAE